VEFVGDNELGARGLEDLQSIMRYTAAAGVESRIKLDPSLARGLSYYTGTIMEISVKDLAGSLGGGGRYDNLVGMFLGESVPACGFSLGLERIIVVMTEREMFPEDLAEDAGEIMVCALGEEYVPDALSIAQTLRSVGNRVLVYPAPGDKLQKQLSYASGQKITLALLIGEHEREQGTVLIRDMHSRDQEWVTREAVVNVVSDKLAEAKRTPGIDNQSEEEAAEIAGKQDA
jgi:histidyl-tRNA synthetase